MVERCLFLFSSIYSSLGKCQKEGRKWDFFPRIMLFFFFNCKFSWSSSSFLFTFVKREEMCGEHIMRSCLFQEVWLGSDWRCIKMLVLYVKLRAIRLTFSSIRIINMSLSVGSMHQRFYLWNNMNNQKLHLWFHVCLQLWLHNEKMLAN